jgi:hypothetical protein
MNPEVKAMTVIVPGIYKKGKLELLETPKGLKDGPVQVLITGIPANQSEPQYLQWGKYSGNTQSTLEDFKEAEWHGEEEFDDLYGPVDHSENASA